MTLRPRIIQHKETGDTRYEFPGWEESGEYTLAKEAKPTRTALLEYAQYRRAQRELAGININGMLVATDDRSKIMISGARQAAVSDPDFVTPWVLADGSHTMLDAPTIIAVSDAVLNHVSWVFELYTHVVLEIGEGKITTTDEIDAIL